MTATPTSPESPRRLRLRRRMRKWWRHARWLAQPLPPFAFQWVRHWFAWQRPLPRVPRTFTDHIFHKMARDRDPLLPRTACKAAMREYVAERLGPGHTPVLFAVLERPEDLLTADLPERYVVKATHGSGMNRIIRRDSLAEREAAVSLARDWFRRAFWRRHGEWAYREVRPRLVVEELLAGPDGEVPPDWKWFCFGGRAELVHFDRGRFATLTRSFYFADGRPAELSIRIPTSPAPPAPPSFARMREMAERLSAPFAYVRVDLYDLGDRVLVGELTHYPSAGLQPVRPLEWDLRLGRLWSEALAARRAGAPPLAR